MIKINTTPTLFSGGALRLVCDDAVMLTHNKEEQTNLVAVLAPVRRMVAKKLFGHILSASQWINTASTAKKHPNACGYSFFAYHKNSQLSANSAYRRIINKG